MVAQSCDEQHLSSDNHNSVIARVPVVLSELLNSCVSATVLDRRLRQLFSPSSPNGPAIRVYSAAAVRELAGKGNRCSQPRGSEIATVLHRWAFTLEISAATLRARRENFRETKKFHSRRRSPPLRPPQTRPGVLSSQLPFRKVRD